MLGEYPTVWECVTIPPVLSSAAITTHQVGEMCTCLSSLTAGERGGPPGPGLDGLGSRLLLSFSSGVTGQVTSPLQQVKWGGGGVTTCFVVVI